MRIRYFSAAALVLLFLGVANGAKAQSVIDPTEGFNPSGIVVSPTSVSWRKIFRFIKRWVKEHMDYRGVTMETHFVYDIGMDSLDFFDLSAAIENEFGTSIGFTFIYNHALIVGDLVYAVEADL